MTRAVAGFGSRFSIFAIKTNNMNLVEEYFSPDCRVSAIQLPFVLCQSGVEGTTAGDDSDTGATWQDEGSDSLVW